MCNRFQMSCNGFTMRCWPARAGTRVSGPTRTFIAPSRRGSLVGTIRSLPEMDGAAQLAHSVATETTLKHLANSGQLQHLIEKLDLPELAQFVSALRQYIHDGTPEQTLAVLPAATDFNMLSGSGMEALNHTARDLAAAVSDMLQHGSAASAAPSTAIDVATASADAALAAGTTATDSLMALGVGDALGDAGLALAANGGADVAATVAGAGELGIQSASGSIATNLTSVAAWVGSRLVHIKDLDAAAFNGLRASIGQVLDSLMAVINSSAATQTEQLTTSLMMSLNEISAAVGSTAGTSSLQAVTAAQEAAAASTLAESAGLEGLMKVMVGSLALIVACVPAEPVKEGARGGAARGKEMTPDDLLKVYDHRALAAYWADRPVAVLQRQAQVVGKMSAFLVGVMADWRMGRWDSNMPKRAAELREHFESLGPAYIKIAQVLSTRMDLLPPAYLEEFARLQDNVPSFSTEQAIQMIEEELQHPVSSIFRDFPDKPIACASLGQVYYTRLVDAYGGDEVAVKVQRPGLSEQISLDVYLMRRTMEIAASLPIFNDEWSDVLDEWASRFFQELDYQLEAYNATMFKKHMASLQGVMVADVYPELTTKRVLTTAWVQGTKLNECADMNVDGLCTTLLNCYLIQLLDTGFLHADPHPGNLLRTPDGRICILDFGLMQEVTLAQRVAMVEFIAHLSLSDWGAVTRDLINLGFIPSSASPEELSQMEPMVETVMRALVEGGGMKGISVTAMSMELQGVAQAYKLVIPPYFALILRSFSVIEGIALQVDPNFGIVNECFPYLARRLLTDNNPRMRGALHQLLYGDKTRLDVERLKRIVHGFSRFSTAPCTSTVEEAKAVEDRVKGQPLLASFLPIAREPQPPVVNETMKEALRVVFSKEGSYAQELLVDELVAATDALSREALGEAVRLVFSSASAVTVLRNVEALGPLRTLFGFNLPPDMLGFLSPSATLTEEDKEALQVIRTALDMMQSAAMGPSDPDKPSPAGSLVLRGAEEIIPMVPELLPGMQATAELFIRQLIRRLALRLANDIQPRRPYPNPGLDAPSMQASPEAPRGGQSPA